MNNDILDINDDLNVSEDNYPQQESGFRPPLPGIYGISPLTFKMAQTKDGELIRWKDSDGNPKYPLFQLDMVEITEPLENGRKVGMFQQVPTYVFDRDGRKASQAADLLLAIDSTATAQNTGDVIRQLTERLAGQGTFRARLDYTAYDGTYAKTTIEARGGKNNLTKQEINKIYNTARITGYKKIQQANVKAGQPNLPLHKWVGPSGDVIEVKPTFTSFYPSSESVALGPDRGLVR